MWRVLRGYVLLTVLLTLVLLENPLVPTEVALAFCPVFFFAIYARLYFQAPKLMKNYRRLNIPRTFTINRSELTVTTADGNMDLIKLNTISRLSRSREFLFAYVDVDLMYSIRDGIWQTPEDEIRFLELLLAGVSPQVSASFKSRYPSMRKNSS